MQRTILFTPDCFHPDIKIIIQIPDGSNCDEYINKYLDSILDENVRFNCDWDYCD